ncbi:MAG TPA: DUF4267 domain-containing protein [Candidatus Binatia bacterium]|jgi:hypothetical protein
MSSWGVRLAGLVSVVILLLGVRAFLDPVAASASFGLPMHSAAETAFVRVYGARNAMLGAVALTLAARGMVRPLVPLFMLATCLPLLDAVVIVSRVGLGPELTRHAIILAVLASISIALWRSPQARA